MGGECWNCGRYLSAGDLLAGYCWDCKALVRPRDGGYPYASSDRVTRDEEDGDDDD
jgi:hypothetical protein